MAKKARRPRPYQPSPKEIVAEWRKEIKRALKPWSLERKVFRKLEPKLRQNIKELQETQEFTRKDRRNSLRVARDCARICKVLQPLPKGPKKVSFDTFQLVLVLCSKHHRTCQTGLGAGGWCDI
jgi:hypothetical protein